MEIVHHASDQSLERYAMQTLPDSESEPLEDHLLICPECRDRLQAETDFLTAMRGAAAKIRRDRERVWSGGRDWRHTETNLRAGLHEVRWCRLTRNGVSDPLSVPVPEK